MLVGFLEPGVGAGGLLLRLLILLGWGATVLLAGWVNVADIRAALRLAGDRSGGNDADESR